MEDLDNTPEPVEITNDSSSTALGAGAPDSLTEDSPDDIREFFKEEISKPEKVEKAEKVEEPVEKEDKAEKEEEPEKAEKEAKPEKAQAKEPEPEKATRQSERRVDRPEAPAQFMPKAKELWRNTPADVQNEVSRIVRDMEEKSKQYEESHKFREELKEFEEITRSNGTTIKEALTKYAEIDTALRNNPSQGLKMLFSELQMSPAQAFGNLMSAYNVTPDQIAAHYREAPHLYTSLAQQANPQYQQQQSQPDPAVLELQQKIAEMERKAEEEKVLAAVVPFRETHPRFDELEDDIAFFLKSGKIPFNMSYEERLEHAYDMAERLNPPSHYSRSEPAGRVEPDSNGSSKSVRSSVGRTPIESYGSDETDDREMFRKMLRSAS